MRILHLSWEYPPLVYGGLGRHVHALAEAQAAAGHEVVVITQWVADQPIESTANGVRIIRAPVDPPFVPFDHDNLLAWVAGMEHAFTRAGLRLAHTWQPDVVHGHDWLVAHASASMKDVYAVPLVATLHATEAGRHQGWLPTDISKAIHSVEWWLTFEARRVITCSAHMAWEANTLFELDTAKSDVIPNGIDLDRWSASPADVTTARALYASSGPLLVFSGRLEWEKGVQTILAAMPRLKRTYPGIKLLIAGQGSQLDTLKQQAKKSRLGRSVSFMGFLQEAELKAILAAADVAIAPSIYEPFGLAALEAAALGTPLVLSDTGGLLEFAALAGSESSGSESSGPVDPAAADIDDEPDTAIARAPGAAVESGTTREGLHAMVFHRGDPVGLAAAVSNVLDDQLGARRRVRKARVALAERHTWAGIAEQTIATYRRAVEDEIAMVYTDNANVELSVRDGNLFTGAHA